MKIKSCILAKVKEEHNESKFLIDNKKPISKRSTQTQY